MTTIFKLKTTLIWLLFIVSINAKAQNIILVPYFSGFDTEAQKQGWRMYELGVQNALYNWNFTSVGAYSETECVFHGYPVGGTQAKDDWLVSPPFDLKEGGNIDSIRTHFSGFGTVGIADTIAIYLLKGGQHPDSAISKKMLFDFRGSEYVNDGLWNLKTDIAIPSDSASSTNVYYIAFRYKTIANWLDVKFDNFSIKTNSSMGMARVSDFEKHLNIYPNPAENGIYIESKYKIESTLLYNMAGTQIEVNTRSGYIDLSLLQPGVYLLKLKANENMACRLVIKK